MSFTLPELPYAYDALAPIFDEETMRIHHTKHHAWYTSKLNAAIEETPLDGLSIEEILVQGFDIPAVRNNWGWYYNHSLFWTILRPAQDNNTPSWDLAQAIEDSFGSFEDFKTQFSEAAATSFGSGWAWLSVQDDKLVISSTPNQDNPIMLDQWVPILGLDVLAALSNVAP